MKPLISVIVPTRNRAQQVAQALDSIVAQEGVGDEFHLDVVVVDDASTDNTAEVVRRYSQARYIRLESPQGAAGARNAGLQEVRGAYLAFLDDDDTWLPHKLRVQLPVLLSDDRTGLVYGQINQVVEGRITSVFPEAQRAASGWIFPKMLMDPGIVSVITVLARRSVFETAGPFDTSLVHCADSDMWTRASFHTGCHFQAGPVAMRHISTTGLYLHGLREGRVERDARRMLEKALLLLPATEEAERQRREARARLEIGLAGELGRTGELERMRSLLHRGLEGNPDLLEDPRIRQLIGNMAGHLVRRSTAPSVTTVRLFVRELLASTPSEVPRQVLRELQAGVWAGAAAAFGENPEHRGTAGYAAVLAVLYGPSRLRDRRLMRWVGGAVLRRPRELLRAHRQVRLPS